METRGYWLAAPVSTRMGSRPKTKKTQMAEQTSAPPRQAWPLKEGGSEILVKINRCHDCDTGILSNNAP